MTDNETKLLEESLYSNNDIKKYEFLWAGMYGEHFRAWSSVFKKEQFLIIKTDELDTNETLNKLSLFLGMNFADKAVVGTKNKTGLARSSLLSQILISQNPIKKFFISFLNDSFRSWLRQELIYMNTSNRKFTLKLGQKIEKRIEEIYDEDRFLFKTMTGIEI